MFVYEKFKKDYEKVVQLELLWVNQIDGHMSIINVN